MEDVITKEELLTFLNEEKESIDKTCDTIEKTEYDIIDGVSNMEIIFKFNDIKKSLSELIDMVQ